jgi:elongator complex protein 4
MPERPPPIPFPASPDSQMKPAIFCHDFDFSKPALPASPSLKCIPTALQMNFQIKPEQRSPFEGFLQHLQSQLSTSPPVMIHRVVIPALLSPTVYPYIASTPSQVLQFLHAFRALLRKYPDRLTALITFPVSLYPRTTGLTRWVEVLSDGVLEIAPFKSQSQVESASNRSGLAKGSEEAQQGMIKLHRLPNFHERSDGSVEPRRLDDLVFHLSRRQGLVIKQFSLPPVNRDNSNVQEGSHEGDSKIDIEF